MEHRLQIDRSRPFCTGFLTHSGAMGLQIRRKLCSLGSIFAVRCHKSDRLLGAKRAVWLR